LLGRFSNALIDRFESVVFHLSDRRNCAQNEVIELPATLCNSPSSWPDRQAPGALVGGGYVSGNVALPNVNEVDGSLQGSPRKDPSI
jgi:hypothetical protein